MEKISFDSYLCQQNHYINDSTRIFFYKIINPIDYILIEEDLMIYEKNSYMNKNSFIQLCNKKNIDYKIYNYNDYIQFSLKYSLPCPINTEKNRKNEYIVLTKKDYFKLLFSCSQSKNNRLIHILYDYLFNM